MKQFRVRSWRELQRYKDRRPSWFCLYTTLRADMDKALAMAGQDELTDSEYGQAVCIMNLTAMHDDPKANPDPPVLPWNPRWVMKASGMTGEPDLDRLLTAGLIECYTNEDSCNVSVTETDDPVPQRQRQSIVQSTEQRTENGAVLQLASGSPADRAAAREEKNRQLSDQWEAWVQALKDANDTPDNVIDDFVAELEACVNRYYEGRGGAFTPKRRATFAARMGKLQFDHQMFAIEVYCDSNAGKADERYCIGIAQRLARTDDKELDQQMMAHRRANKGTGLNARAGTA